MYEISTELEGFKAVQYWTGKMRPAGKIRKSRGRTSPIPPMPDWLLGVLQLRAYPPIFDFAGDECLECTNVNRRCNARHGLRAGAILPLAVFGRNGTRVRNDAAIRSAFGSASLDFFYVIGQLRISPIPPVAENHPHGHGIHFFRTRDEIDEYFRGFRRVDGLGQMAG